MRNRFAEIDKDADTSRITGAVSTTMGVLLTNAEAAPARTIIIHKPITPSRAHIFTEKRINSPSKPLSSIA